MGRYGKVKIKQKFIKKDQRNAECKSEKGTAKQNTVKRYTHTAVLPFDGIYIADNLHKILVFVSVQRLGGFQLLFYGGQIYAERQGAVPRYL